MRRDSERWLGLGLITLGVLVATSAALGPLLFDVLVYRTSATSLNQVIGVDAVGLCVVAPVSVIIGVLVWRGRRGAPLLGLAPAVFAAYTFTQLIVGNEYGVLAGNVEDFFPLLLATFIVAVSVAIGAWRASAAEALPPTSHGADRAAGAVMLALAAFVVLGLHLPTYLDAMSDAPTGAGYLSSPTAFWLVKFMDLGIVTPLAVCVGIGMLGHRAWALRPFYALLGGFALLAISVAAMAMAMYVTADPESSLGLVIASALAAGAMVALAAYWYLPLLRHGTAVPAVGDDQSYLTQPYSVVRRRDDAQLGSHEPRREWDSVG